MNLTLASIIFENISNHEFYSLGTCIVDAINAAVDANVEGIGQFLDSRFRAATTFKNSSQRAPKKDRVQTAAFSRFITQDDKEDKYAICEAEIWSGQKKIQNELFVKGTSSSLTPMTLQYFDIPRIYD